MPYVFAIEGTQYLKVGYTSTCPWERARDGFWRVVHPKACCGQLGWENLRLLLLSPGTLAEEKQLHDCLQFEDGEFYPLEQLDSIKLFFKLNGWNHGCGNDDWELPLPEKPAAPPLGRGIEKRPCCGGSGVICYACERHFALWIHLSTHMRESCPMRQASEQAKVECGTCATHVIKRNLKRHQASSGCRVHSTLHLSSV